MVAALAASHPQSVKDEPGSLDKIRWLRFAAKHLKLRRQNKDQKKDGNTVPSCRKLLKHSDGQA